jgi:transcriptional regulator with XRE-family HTH domain
VTQHWNAVAATIDEYMIRLGLDTPQLADRAHVSCSTIRELRHNTVQRRRDGRILQALSTALELDPRHLAAVAAGHPPPTRNNPTSATDRLTRIEQCLNEIAAQVNSMNAAIAVAIRAAQDRQTGPTG